MLSDREMKTSAMLAMRRAEGQVTISGGFWEHWGRVGNGGLLDHTGYTLEREQKDRLVLITDCEKGRVKDVISLLNGFSSLCHYYFFSTPPKPLKHSLAL